MTLHLLGGKCLMMTNTPLPDIEILLRSSSPDLTSPRTMLRVRFLRRISRLEIARRTSHDSSSEWVKRVVTCKDAFPFLLGDEWKSLYALERRGLKVLEMFLSVCSGALELGMQAEGMEVQDSGAETEDEGSTFDSDFTPNFVPDLASSLPPRPVTLHFDPGTSK